MMHRYLPVIEDLSIPTFFVDQLDERVDEEMGSPRVARGFYQEGRKGTRGLGRGDVDLPSALLCGDADAL